MGQSGHGKTVQANLLINYLRKQNKPVFHIDGDDLRDLTTNKDYSKNGRIENIKRAQIIAKYLQNKGNNVVVSLMTPYKDIREDFKSSTENVYEIYVNTNEIRGREDFHVNDFEIPDTNYLNLDTTNKDPEDSLDEILEYAGI
jgi:adenylylsulfate kinase-like enzyme